ncbi:hypothetical protein ATZ20_01165 [Sulfolobus acidocaldarius]|uniref:Uncharacterized protein n=2 Tax=Sulfolobus acidocaldarius TaxID=2285 RepID=A0A0U3FU97_9CREN|nr:hypothetical protein ATZ20_01165 [Sulfolobus acidocaldarius]
MRNMKIKILKTDSGYEIEVSDDELLSLFNKFLEEINKMNEKETKELIEESQAKVQDILGQILGGKE